MLPSDSFRYSGASPDMLFLVRIFFQNRLIQPLQLNALIPWIFTMFIWRTGDKRWIKFQFTRNALLCG